MYNMYKMRKMKLKKHKLTCGWCNHDQNSEPIDVWFCARGNPTRLSYPCDVCKRGLQIYRSANGFYSCYQADRLRYLRNVAKGVNRI